MLFSRFVISECLWRSAEVGSLTNRAHGWRRKSYDISTSPLSHKLNLWKTICSSIWNNPFRCVCVGGEWGRGGCLMTALDSFWAPCRVDRPTIWINGGRYNTAIASPLSALIEPIHSCQLLGTDGIAGVPVRPHRSKKKQNNKKNKTKPKPLFGQGSGSDGCNFHLETNISQRDRSKPVRLFYFPWVKGVWIKKKTTFRRLRLSYTHTHRHLVKSEIWLMQTFASLNRRCKSNCICVLRGSKIQMVRIKTSPQHSEPPPPACLGVDTRINNRAVGRRQDFALIKLKSNTFFYLIEHGLFLMPKEAFLKFVHFLFKCTSRFWGGVGASRLIPEHCCSSFGLCLLLYKTR